MSQTNAKQEFLKLVRQAGAKVRCATVHFGETYDENDDLAPLNQANLSEAYKQDEYDAFLAALDQDYDSGFGGQELFGTVWFVDGTWATRGEYDGSEWWDHHTTPEIQDELKQKRQDKIENFLETI